MTQLGLQSINNTKLREEWATGAKTYLGTTVPGYPNMFHIFGVHGPTLLSNGPTIVEIQGRWIADLIQKMERKNIRYINPKSTAADSWKAKIVQRTERTLFPTTKSTYMGGDIPGKVYEPVCYGAGVPAYAREIRAALDTMDGLDIVFDETRASL